MSTDNLVVSISFRFFSFVFLGLTGLIYCVKWGMTYDILPGFCCELILPDVRCCRWWYGSNHIDGALGITPCKEVRFRVGRHRYTSACTFILIEDQHLLFMGESEGDIDELRLGIHQGGLEALDVFWDSICTYRIGYGVPTVRLQVVVCLYTSFVEVGKSLVMVGDDHWHPILKFLNWPCWIEILPQ